MKRSERLKMLKSAVKQIENYSVLDMERVLGLARKTVERIVADRPESLTPVMLTHCAGGSLVTAYFQEFIPDKKHEMMMLAAIDIMRRDMMPLSFTLVSECWICQQEEIDGYDSVSEVPAKKEFVVIACMTMGKMARASFGEIHRDADGQIERVGPWELAEGDNVQATLMDSAVAGAAAGVLEWLEKDEVDEC